MSPLDSNFRVIFSVTSLVAPRARTRRRERRLVAVPDDEWLHLERETVDIATVGEA